MISKGIDIARCESRPFSRRDGFAVVYLTLYRRGRLAVADQMHSLEGTHWPMWISPFLERTDKPLRFYVPEGAYTSLWFLISPPKGRISRCVSQQFLKGNICHYGSD